MSKPFTSPRLGAIMSENDVAIEADKAFFNTASVFYDGVYVPGGTASVATLEADPDALHFLNEAFRHCKPIAANDEALQVLRATYFGGKNPKEKRYETLETEGIIIGANKNFASGFINALAKHRFWDREKIRKIPA